MLYLEWASIYISTSTLRYKPEGSGVDSRWGHWYFSLT